MPQPRVISLLASSTEIVSALGYGHLLVARSHECDFPDFVKHLPMVTETKFPVDVASREIDRQVRTIVRDGLSVYRVAAEQLRELRPDVILTQDHCEVCAVSTRDVEAAVCDWLGSDVQIVSLRPDSLSHVFNDIRRVADALGDSARGDQLVAELRARMTAIQRRTLEVEERPRVAFIEWIDPLMAGGNWVPELIEMAGGNDVLGRKGEHSSWIEFDRLHDAQPDVIVVAPCGFDLERTHSEMPPLATTPRWTELPAVRKDRVYVTDGNSYFNRPGPRLVESLELLAEMIHPALFHYGHEGAAWRRYRAR